MKNELLRFGDVFEDVSMSEHTTYKIGGKAKYLLIPSSSDNLISAVEYLNTKEIKHFLLGNGSNIIMPDEDYDGVMIKLEALDHYDLNRETGELFVEAGVFMPKISTYISLIGYTGLEWAGGLPGTVGGTIVSNAEAYKISISDMIKSVTVYYRGKIRNLQRKEIFFAYRTSQFKEDHRYVILSAVLQVKKNGLEEIRELMKNRAKWRIENQPLEYPSCGSVFRNPDAQDIQEQIKKYNLEIYSAGYLIEQSGLKGYQIGGAKVSGKHANFIINVGNATSKDIKALIALIQEKVKEKFEVELILEQVIINW